MTTCAFSAQKAPEHDLKAAYIYNFIQFTEWPEDGLKSSTLNVCASAGTVLYVALQAIVGKTSHNRTIALKSLQTTPATDCNVLIAEKSDRELYSQIRHKIANLPILTISDDAELTTGDFMITIAILNERIRFVINSTRALEVKMVFSSRLLRLAAKVL